MTSDVDVDESAVADYHRRNPPASSVAPARPPNSPRSPPGSLHCSAVRPGGGPSGSGSSNAGRRWSGLRPDTNIQETHANPTTPTGIDMFSTLALDIGGTKVAAGLVDPDGRLLHQNRQPTPRSGDPDEVFAAVSRVVADALAAADGPVSGGASPRLGPSTFQRAPSVRSISGPGAAFRSASVQVAAAVPGCRWNWPATGCAWRWGALAGAGQGAAFMLGMVISTGIEAG